MATEKDEKRPLCNGCKNRPKTIDSDVKEKYETIPPQTRGEKGMQLFIDPPADRKEL